MGILSYQWMPAPQDGQAEGGRTMESPAGSLKIQTLRKLPMHNPTIKTYHLIRAGAIDFPSNERSENRQFRIGRIGRAQPFRQGGGAGEPAAIICPRSGVPAGQAAVANDLGIQLGH